MSKPSPSLPGPGSGSSRRRPARAPCRTGSGAGPRCRAPSRRRWGRVSVTVPAGARASSTTSPGRMAADTLATGVCAPRRTRQRRSEEHSSARAGRGDLHPSQRLSAPRLHEVDTPARRLAAPRADGDAVASSAGDRVTGVLSGSEARSLRRPSDSWPPFAARPSCGRIRACRRGHRARRRSPLRAAPRARPRA